MRRYRVGTTSYVVRDDILPNVRFLADRVEDVELVLFEIDDGPNNLLSPTEVRALAEIGRKHDLTYTVHLPLDLRLGDGGPRRHRSLEKAHAVMDRTWLLDPWAYVLHLDGEAVEDRDAWVDQAVESLSQAANWAGEAQRLAVENLEGYPLDFIDPVLARVEASRCVDVGHLWLDGHDPVPFLWKHAARTSVIHLHGVGHRDHQSLAHMDREQLEAVLVALEELSFAGVLTLEVFNQRDLTESLDALRKAGMPWPAH